MKQPEGYRALHTWLCRHYPKAGVCDECGTDAKRTEYALIHGQAYTRDRDHYRELCKMCHNRYDEVGGSRWKNILTPRKLAGDPPFCKCGCGTQTTWDRNRQRYHRFAPGHYAGEARGLAWKGLI